MKNIPVIIPYIGGKEIKLIEETLKSGWIAQGPKVAEFESLVAKHEGIKYGTATTNCTTALHLALVALGAGVGDDIIVPSFTFVATPNSVMYTGATPIFVDVLTSTYNMDIDSLNSTIETQYDLKDGKLINKKTGNFLKGIIAVNEFGLCADLKEIQKIAKKHKIFLLEDSACAFGAKINDKHEGNFSEASCLSFHPRKSITTGEGGMLLTNSKKINDIAKKLRSHGASISEINRHRNKGYLLPDFDDLGFNYRMTDIQGAMGIAQLENFEMVTERRRKLAQSYRKLLSDIDFLIPPFVPENYYHTYQSFVCMIDYKKLGLKSIKAGNEFRNNLMDYLEKNGIATRVGTHATHMLGIYRKKYGYKPQDLMGSYQCDQLSITLPLYHVLSSEDQKYVVDYIRKGAEKIMKGEYNAQDN